MIIIHDVTHDLVYSPSTGLLLAFYGFPPGLLVPPPVSILCIECHIAVVLLTIEYSTSSVFFA
jgi:hypothetical protein